MADALVALEQVAAGVNQLAAAVAAARGKFVEPEKVHSIALQLLSTYYEHVHAELDLIDRRPGLMDEIDFVLGAILQLTNAPRRKTAYERQITELRPYLQEAIIAVMKGRGKPRLVLSNSERGIHGTLQKMLPSTAVSYEQVLRDIAEAKTRVSWRGPGTELREVLREVIDHLAPDDKVMATPGFKLEGDQTRPTQRQKVRFILRARRASAHAVATAEASLETLDEGIAVLARLTYQRSNLSTHAPTDATEIRRLKNYVDALLVDLLEIAGS